MSYFNLQCLVHSFKHLFNLFQIYLYYQLGSSVAVGDDSCLGFSVCEGLSGDVIIGSESCYGLKACSNFSEHDTVRIGSGSCTGARSCSLLSGYTLALNSSCYGARSCMGIRDGKMFESSP